MRNHLSLIRDLIAENLKGSWTWPGFVAHSRPDCKFGYSKFNYVAQIPIVGLCFILALAVLFYLILYPLAWIVKNF